MASFKKEKAWELINRSCREIERDIARGRNADALAKSSELADFMVRQHAAHAHISQKLSARDMVEKLYERKWITSESRENFTKIRRLCSFGISLGNSAALQAGTCLQLLQQETWTFANDFSNAPKGAKKSGAVSGSEKEKFLRMVAFGVRETVRKVGMACFFIFILALCVMFLRSKFKGSALPDETFAVMSLIPIHQTDDDVSENTELGTVTESTVPKAREFVASMPAPVPVEGQEESSLAGYKKMRTKDVLNLRSAPSMDAEIVARLQEDVLVEYMGAVDETWSRVYFRGQILYAVSEYLEEP